MQKILLMIKSKRYEKDKVDFAEILPDFQNGTFIQNSNREIEVILYDTYGQVVRKITSSGENVQFDVTRLRNGMYYLHVVEKIAGVNSKAVKRQIVVRHS